MLKQLPGLCNSNSSDFWRQCLLYPGDGSVRPFHPLPAAAAAGVLGKGIFTALVKGWNIWGKMMPSPHSMSLPNIVQPRPKHEKWSLLATYPFPSSLDVRWMSGRKSGNSSWSGSCSRHECWRATGNRNEGAHEERLVQYLGLCCLCSLGTASQRVSRVHLLAGVEWPQ